MKHAKQYFDNHPMADVLWFTADDIAFFDEQCAINHARYLDDDTIATHTRDEAEDDLQNAA